MTETKTRTRQAVLCVNLLIVLLTALGAVIMLLTRGGGPLKSYGIANLKYFTVLSNIFEGVVSLFLAVHLMGGAQNGVPRWIFRLKYIAAAAVFLTFLVVGLFFAPIYTLFLHANAGGPSAEPGGGMLLFYQGANFWFHLVIPVIAIAEFILLDRFGELRFRDTRLAVLPPLIYGIAYCVNLLINGVGTPPDHINDIYFFLSWGLPVGLCIFAAILLLGWIAGILLRQGNRAGRIHKGTEDTV